MAQLNQAASESHDNNAAEGKKPTHYLNINLVLGDGSTVPVGAIPVYQNANKAQRSLINLFDKQPDKVAQVALSMVIRKNEPGTDMFDIADLCFVEETVVTAKA